MTTLTPPVPALLHARARAHTHTHTHIRACVRKLRAMLCGCVCVFVCVCLCACLRLSEYGVQHLYAHAGACCAQPRASALASRPCGFRKANVCCVSNHVPPGTPRLTSCVCASSGDILERGGRLRQKAARVSAHVRNQLLTSPPAGLPRATPGLLHPKGPLR